MYIIYTKASSNDQKCYLRLCRVAHPGKMGAPSMVVLVVGAMGDPSMMGAMLS